MKTLPQTTLLLLASLAIGSLDPAQGDTGFLRGKGRFDASYSYTVDYYDEFWVGEERVSPAQVGKVERETASLYAAYGLCENIDLVMSANYVEAETDGTDGTIEDENDLQDLYLGAKWRACTRGVGPGTLSAFLAPSIKVPMTDYEDNAVTAIGDGQVDLRFRGIVHYELGGCWASLETGYDRRNGAPHDEVPVNLTLGGTLADRVTLMPFFSTLESRGGVDIGADRFPATEEENSRVGLAAYARLWKHFGVTALWRTTLDGKNTGDADTFSLGVVFGPCGGGEDQHWALR